MSRQGVAYLVAFLATAAAVVVYFAVAQPASSEAARASAEKAQLESEVDSLRAQLRRFQGTEPPSLPELSSLQDRVADIASTLPPEAGYSIKTDAPQPFPPGAQPVATQVRVLATVEGDYDRSVALIRSLSELPEAAVEEMSISRIQGKPGTLRAFAAIVLLFEASGAPAPTQPVSPTTGPTLPGRPPAGPALPGGGQP